MAGKISGFELMSRAGQFSFDCLCERYADVRQIVILCGSGNNGGDGYIIAGLAAENNYKVSVYAYAPPTTDDSNLARDYAQKMGCRIVDCQDEPDLSNEINTADLIVDALLGTGVDRDINGYLATLIGWVNSSQKPVLACDIATGLNSDSGRVMGHCIKATATQTFIALKPGLFTASGKTQSGVVQFSDLGVPQEYYLPNQACASLMSRRNLGVTVQQREETAHKGTTGYAAVIGGAPGMMGAVLMAANAAYRAGSGRVKVLTHNNHCSELASYCPELLTLECDEHTQIFDEMADFNVLALGPGMGQSTWAKRLFNQAMQTDRLKVLDADALNLLSKDKQKCDHWVLTPHPGEAATLLNCTANEIQDDRFAAANEIVNQYGGVCVLKGSGSLIASNEHLTHVCRAGNAGQATAGMGDVLTGCILGFIAQGYGLFDAACLGTWCHAAAADHVADNMGKIGMMATDLLLPIQQLHNELINAKSP